MYSSDIFGRLTWHALKHNAIELVASLSMFVAALLVIFLLTYYKRWKWLWTEYLTNLDPKRIGVMYTVVVFVMLFKGLFDAGMMRLQQVLSTGDSHGYLTSSHFQQLFTAHGVTMIFFVGMGIVFGLMNFIVPLQIGARDVAYPFLNLIGFYLFAAGALLVNISLAIGSFSGAGWLAYPPLSGLVYNPGVGIDYWIWILQISGVGSLISGINFFVTIFKLRAPGMTWMKMPMFIWATLATVILIIFAFPILTAALWLLSLDRLIGMHIFSPSFGGNPMMFVNLIWAWGHPEVYILILPAFGVFSEVVATFSHKRLFGYTSMVWAIIAITFLSFIVWLHHFFTMGASASVNAFFGIMTMLIAIPTGVKIFNWLFTMYGGHVSFKTPMLWFLGFIIAFTIGGMAGVLMSIPAVDFQVHNSLFLIAHFHSVILPGVVFGFFAALTYWYPKFTGHKLDEKLGRRAVECWVVGYLLAFIPLYVLGLMGATRRLDHYDAATGWQPLFIVAAIGLCIIAAGMFFQVAQIVVSFRERDQNKVHTGDPWNGRTLEWSTPCPPPVYNFAIIPTVTHRDEFWFMKHNPQQHKPHYQDILVPKNSALPLYIGMCSLVFGFAITWHMFWLAILSLIGFVVCMIIRFAQKETEYLITAVELQHLESQSPHPYAWENK